MAAAVLWRALVAAAPASPAVGKALDVLWGAPLVEEAIFRGALLHVLLNRAPSYPLACVAAQAVVFGE